MDKKSCVLELRKRANAAGSADRTDAFNEAAALVESISAPKKAKEAPSLVDAPAAPKEKKSKTSKK
jgi:hypothetical protein